MYLSHWQLKEKPFSNTPDPQFFFSSRQHEDALMKLSYVITENAGAGMLSGVYGCGKTVVAHSLMKNLGSGYKFSYISYPHPRPDDLLRSIVRSFIPGPLPDLKSEILMDSLLQKLAEFIQSTNRSGMGVVVLIDEAHLIKDENVLESVRLLLNFQTDKDFLLSIILIGQPELSETVANLTQLRQRIAVHCKLARLSEEETRGYILSRLKAAGAEKEIFTEDSLGEIYESASGIPRNINRICELSLFSGFAEKKLEIDRELIQKVIQEFGLQA